MGNAPTTFTAASTYGVKLTAAGFSVVATPRLRERPRREENAHLYRLVGAAAGSGARAEDGPGPSALVRVGDRLLGTFPESKQNRYGGGGGG